MVVSGLAMHDEHLRALEGDAMPFKQVCRCYEDGDDYASSTL